MDDKLMIRGSEVRINWDLMKKEAVFDAELQKLSPAILAELESTEKWVPLEVEMTLHDLFHRVRGKEALLRWNYDALLAGMRTSALKPFIEGTRKLLGLKPQHLFLLSPKVWTLYFRNCGVVKVLKREKKYAVIEHSGLPSEMCLAGRFYVESFIGSYEAVIAICELEGTVRIVEYDRDAGRAVVEARWNAPSAAH